MNDYEFALIVENLYDDQSQFDKVLHIAGVDVGLKFTPECNILIREGSHDVPDYERDFTALMITVPGIGRVHEGFNEGTEELIATVMPMLPKDKPTKVGGHSLGAGGAHIMTARLAAAGYTLLETIAFGSPYPGDAQLAQVLAPFPNRSYWNYHNPFHHDIVGSVPIYLPDEPYVMPRERILIDQPPPVGDAWGMAAWHHFNPLYLAGVKALCSAP